MATKYIQSHQGLGCRYDDDETWPTATENDGDAGPESGGMLDGACQDTTSSQPMMVQMGSNFAADLARLGAPSLNGAEGFGAMNPGGPAPPAEWGNTTTIMMRNLPNKYTQRMLLTEINQTGFLGTFDFLYLPIDPETNANRGYSFLNFVDPRCAWWFKNTYEGRKMARFNSNKVVSVVPATLQGFEANYAHYASSRVNRGDPAARPLFLREPKQQMGGNHATPSNGGKGRRRNGGNAGGNNENVNVHQHQHQQQENPFEQMAAMGMPPWAGMPFGPYMGFPDLTAANNPFPAFGACSVESLPAPPSSGNSAMDANAADARPAGAGAGVGANAGGETAARVPQFCPTCGGKIQPQFQFCPHCGGSLDFSLDDDEDDDDEEDDRQAWA